MRDSIYSDFIDQLTSEPNPVFTLEKHPKAYKPIDISMPNWGEKTSAKIKDSVDSPSHYTTGEIEVIKYIKDKLTKEEFEGYCVGNVIKYVSRWRHKGGQEDLRKAEKYLSFLTKGV